MQCIRKVQERSTGKRAENKRKEKRRARRWKGEVKGGMMAVCGEGICHILSGDRSDRYSIASAVLGNRKHTNTHRHTHPHTHKHRAGPAKLIWHSTAARPPCRAVVAVGGGPDHFGQYH